MIAVPLVSVMNCDRKPMSPRAGIRNSSRDQPEPGVDIVTMRGRAEQGLDAGFPIIGFLALWRFEHACGFTHHR